MSEQHFHSKEIGCVFEPRQKEASNPKAPDHPRLLNYTYCEIHGVEVCRCGYTFGQHPL
jgi:hypothetical protein